MQNTTSVLPKQARFSPSRIIHFLFYGILLGIIATSRLPPATRQILLFKKEFLSGREAFFRLQDPGLPYTLFKTYRPADKRASFLTDIADVSNPRAAEQLQAAQGSMVPLFLNSDSIENTAFVFCSGNEIARARMQATGYRPVAVLGNGKMIAEKKS